MKPSATLRIHAAAIRPPFQMAYCPPPTSKVDRAFRRGRRPPPPFSWLGWSVIASGVVWWVIVAAVYGKVIR